MKIDSLLEQANKKHKSKSAQGQFLETKACTMQILNQEVFGGQGGGARRVVSDKRCLIM